MVTIEDISDAIIQLIRVGTVLRITYIFVRMSHDEDIITLFLKRCRNIIVFYVLAESIWQLKDLAIHYYG